MVGEGGATNGAGNAESNNVTYKENNNNKNKAFLLLVYY